MVFNLFVPGFDRPMRFTAAPPWRERSRTHMRGKETEREGVGNVSSGCRRAARTFATDIASLKVRPADRC